MKEYFVCTNCFNIQHTTTFGQCVECGQEALVCIDTMVKDVMVPRILGIAEASHHTLDQDTAYDIAFEHISHILTVTLPAVVRSHLVMHPETVEYRAEFFVIDDAETMYEGFTQGRTWNGWACPSFTKEIALQMVENYNKEAHPLKAWYDEKEDAFSFEMEANSPESTDTFHGHDIDVDGETLHVYSIGAGCWIWDVFGGSKNDPYKAKCEHPQDSRSTIRVNRGIGLAELEYCKECGLVLSDKVIESF